MSKKQNLVNGRGETFTLNLTYKDTNGAAIDLTGHTASLVVEKASIGTAVGTYAGTVDSEGHIDFNVADEVTATWPVGKLAYRVIHQDPAGNKRWLVFGALTVIDGNDV